MSRPYRVFIPETAPGQEIPLNQGDARHLAVVLRLGPGAAVTGFDGRGQVYEGVLTRVQSRAVVMRVDRVAAAPRPPEPELCLALALVRDDPFEWAVQKATELGCARLQPLQGTFGTPRGKRPGPSRLERWRRISLESLKQCRRNFLMTIDPPCDSREFFARAEAGEKMLLHPVEAPALPDCLAGGDSRPGRVIVAIGPEGGWSPAELAAAEQAGFRRFSLGPLILRTETAAVAVLALLAARFHWSRQS